MTLFELGKHSKGMRLKMRRERELSQCKSRFCQEERESYHSVSRDSAKKRERVITV